MNGALAVATGARNARHRRPDGSGSTSKKRRRDGHGGGVSTLMYAAQQGDVERVRRILRAQSTNLFERDRSGKSALHYSSTSDNIRAAQAADLLVMAAPDLIETHDEDGFTPLHLAVIAGNMQLVTFLLANNADVNALDNEKHTVVHWATVCGETAALRAVLAAGAPVSTPDVHGGYPLHYAAQMCGGDKDSSLGMQVLQTLLAHGDVSVKVMDGDKRQPLLWAASAGSAKAVLALIRAGADVEACDKDGLTALHCAASRGHTDTIDTLLTLCGASPDVIDTNGCTALHYAVTLGHADATALLLAHGADPNRQDRKGRSPAHCGCAKGQFETVKLIGAHGANLWLRNARGDLPLHDAAASGRRELVKWLLEMRPSQVNSRNNDGRCPLHMAALHDNSDMCKILLDAGAQINPILRTSKNVFMTPLDCALQRGFRSTAKYLQVHGGVPASRLGDGRFQQAGGNSAMSLQIRDDVTFWGDTSSDSERENGLDTDKSGRKTFRKKLAYKYDRKKPSISGSDIEMEKMKSKKLEARKMKDKGRSSKSTSRTNTSAIDSRKSSSRLSSKSQLDYTNEIVINGTTEINIHQTKEIIIEPGSEIRDTTQTDVYLPSESPQIEKDKRPKSAKFSKIKSSSSREASSKDKSGKKLVGILKDQSTNTSDETTETVIDNFKNKINVESTIKLNGKTLTDFHDQQSMISNTSEDVEEPRDIVVEASVHAPPKEHELEIKTEIDINKEAIEQETRTDENEKSKKDVSDIESKILGELVTEEIERKETQQEKAQPVSEEMTEQTSTEKDKPVIDDKIEKVASPKVVSPEAKSVVETEEADVKDPEVAIESITISEKKDETEKEQLEKEKEQLEKEKELLVKEKEQLLKEKEQIEESLREKSEEIKPEELPTEPVTIPDPVIETEKGDDEKTNAEKADLVKVQSESPSVDQISGKDELDKTEDKAILQIIRSEDEISDSTKVGDLKTGAILKIIKSDEEVSEKTGQKEVKIKSSKEKSVKRGKLVKTKRSEDIPDEDLTSISSESSSSAHKSHKSFQILDNGAITEDKRTVVKSRKSKTGKDKEHRPKSEESKVQEPGVQERKLKKSKIPTLVSSKDLSKSDKTIDRLEKYERKTKSSMETRVPSLPNIDDKAQLRVIPRSDSNLSAPLLTSLYSDNERGSASDFEEERRSSSLRRRRTKRRPKTRESRSAGSDYESSNLIDSGFEPSPRSTRVHRWKNMTDRGVNMKTVTQTIQSNIRRYHLERKIFQHLLELKRYQIRSNQHNEAMLVKRAIDAYHQSCAATVGAGRYVADDYTFKSFEKFLYESLRKLQKNGAEYMKGLPETPNPLHCTKTTNRCLHTTHAYTGVPCAAYLPKMDHHSIPKIGFEDSCKPGTGFLPTINPKKAVTLELTHGPDKQIISLPTDRLDQNKRYYVTFTVKGNGNSSSPDENPTNLHTHSKSD